MLKAFFLSAAVLSASPAGDPLTHFLWRSRVLLVFAAKADDPRITDQRSVERTLSSGGDDRDLVIVEANAQASASVLRRRFGVAPSAFAVVLIGKDGGVKIKSDRVISARDLSATIDAMPMRQEEVRRLRRQGS